jgi:hypothetical protein
MRTPSNAIAVTLNGVALTSTGMAVTPHGIFVTSNERPRREKNRPVRTRKSILASNYGWKASAGWSGALLSFLSP